MVDGYPVKWTNFVVKPAGHFRALRVGTIARAEESAASSPDSDGGPCHQP
jgi:hypothetical protein